MCSSRSSPSGLAVKVGAFGEIGVSVGDQVVADAVLAVVMADGQ